MPIESLLRKGLEQALSFGEVGVQVAAYIGDDLVVDSIGCADLDSGRPVDENTLFPIFSVSKQIVATALYILVERGLVSVELPMAEYWPEFAAKGKDRVTVAQVLAHQSGVVSFGSPHPKSVDDLRDWDQVVANLAAAELAFTPGEKSSYQALNHGYMLGEIIRRTDPQHRSLSEFVHEEISEPLGIKDLYFGTPPSEHHRVATLTTEFTLKGMASDLIAQAVPAPMGFAPALRNDPAVWEAGWPSCGAIATASSVARFWAMLANGGEFRGVRILPEDRVRSFLTPRPFISGPDELMGFPFKMSTAGFYIAGPPWREEFMLGGDPNSNVLCGIGAGATLAFANLDLKLAVSICHNRMFDGHPGLPEETHPFAGIGRAIYQLVSKGPTALASLKA
jgi:CubicO group peptidase (beta-lactamase class C family)